MTTTITFRCTEEQKKAIYGYAKLHNSNISNVILETILNKIEDENDYELALMVANEPTIDIEDLAKECGIDYEKI